MTVGSGANDRSGASVGDGQRGIRWELISVAVGLAAIVIAEPSLPTGWSLALVVAAAGLVLFAFRLPQWTFRSLTEAADSFVGAAWVSRQSQEARERLGGAAEQVSELLARSASQKVGRATRIPSVLRPRRLFILSEYERKYRPGVLHAVTLAINAGASEEGALALAQSPRDVADLHALLAQLRRMMIELG